MRKRILLIATALLALGLLGASAATAGGDLPCLQCHEDAAKAFMAGPHGKAMAARSAETRERSCAACHGPVEAHLEEPSKENISTPGPGACASCHADAKGKLELASPAHPRNGVECLDCHVSGHGPAKAKLLKGSTSEVCGTCHATQLAKFNLPFAHRRGTARPFECVECHATHGTGEVGLVSRLNNGGVCIRCHTEKAGPFVFPHPPREVEGCLACHDPHGSVNPRQLIRYRVADLCLECHTGVPSFHNLSTPKYQSCQRCHVAVHGSNRNPALFDE